MGDPRERGSEESSYLAEWRTRLQLYKDWVAEANAVLGSNVSVGAALLDSERFWFRSMFFFFFLFQHVQVLI